MINKQKGLIYTNSNCIGCNKCILGCPVPGANQSVVINGQHRIVVDSTRCIHCGYCLTNCSHGAREYVDDTEDFLEDLSRGEKISLIVSPAFLLDNPDLGGRVINYLRSQGLAGVYDGGFGADIMTWAYIKYLEEHPEGGKTTQSCPVFVNYLEKYSMTAKEYMFPIQSDTMCSAIYIRKYMKDENRLAFLSPCIAKKDEFEAPSSEGIVTYNVTFRHLFKALEKVDLSTYENEVYFKSDGFGSMFDVSGGSVDVLRKFLPQDKMIVNFDNALYQYRYTDYYENDIYKTGRAPYIVDVINCTRGCVMGPGTQRDKIDLIGIWEQTNCTRNGIIGDKDSVYGSNDYQVNKKKLLKRFDKLDYYDFTRDYQDRYTQERNIPDSIIKEVFSYMHKDTENKQHIDCHSCGYGSCIEMAKSIAKGYNRRENCVHYEKDENARLFLTDTLTGIGNINALEKALMEIFKKGKGAAYSLVNFTVNEWELMSEQYGYEERDNLLKELAAAACEGLMDDEIVCRKSDDDFIALIKQKNLDMFIDDLNNIVVHPSMDDSIEYRISVKAGVYNLKPEDNQSGDVIAKAQLARKRGQNSDTLEYTLYNDNMKENLLESMKLMKACPKALKNREFVVFYQPKVGLGNLKLNGAEALVRWRKKNGTMVSPGKFIPLFEKNGYVVYIDFYVLDQVCKDLRGWIDDGHEPVRISSNFSRQHIKDPELVQSIIAVVDKYSIPHSLIEIEFTETAYEDDAEKLKNILLELRENGFSTSIDDFGSGYSSLNMLQSLDFQVLKLDKSFLETGVENMKSREVIGSVIDMAKKLDMEIVAEGVEKKEEMEFLKTLNCDMIQGYYFDKPMPGDDFITRLSSPDYIPKE